jgi:hypothetical protein
MSCDFAHDDGAYVLGALGPAERLEFERHLPGCGACTRAVRELAGLPGLLGRVDPSVLEQPPAEEPVPETLLPRLSHEVRRGRRRRSFAVAGVAAAAVAAVAALAVPVVLGRVGDDPVASPSAAASATASTPVPTRSMAALGEVPVQATLGLQQVTWGTRLLLTCTYEPASVTYDLPPAVDYTLFVRTREGRTEQVGSWRSVAGATMHISTATSVVPADIASVEVRTTEGRVVLRLRA